MISEERRKSGSDSRIVSYREKVIGDPSKERDRLEAISPVNFADQFQAPVLLINSRDDTVVPMRQSSMMERALKRADKLVTFVKLDGEDHWLSTSQMRLETLRQLGRFVDSRIGRQVD